MENEVKNQNVIPVYKRYKDYNVELYTIDPTIERRVISGKALLTPEKNEFLFAQNKPRGARSVEIGRTMHSRFRRSPDGSYVATFRFDHSERNIREQLIAEVRDMYKGVDLDAQKQRFKEQQAKKEDEK